MNAVAIGATWIHAMAIVVLMGYYAVVLLLTAAAQLA